MNAVLYYILELEIENLQSDYSDLQETRKL